MSKASGLLETGSERVNINAWDDKTDYDNSHVIFASCDKIGH